MGSSRLERSFCALLAQALVLLAEGLGWDEKTRSSHLGRFVQCLDQLIEQAGQ